MSDRLLPEPFADLEPYARVWALATEGERYDRRLASTMDELQAFYDACFGRVEEAITYCDQFALDEMPADAVNLMRLLYSLVIVSMPVEAWRQPQVPDAGAARLDRIVEPVP
ncbi:MAG: hypothetical protein AMXMBFR46_08250 [Acidimicrobiia bacterium]